MSKLLVCNVLLNEPVTPDMRAVARVLRSRYPGLAVTAHDGNADPDPNDPIFLCDGNLVVVMSFPSPLPGSSVEWAYARESLSERDKALAAQHRGFLTVSTVEKKLPSLLAARITTAVIGAIIATMPQVCCVVWDPQIVSSSERWAEMSHSAFAPYPHYPFTLWIDILPTRRENGIGAITLGLAEFVGREIEFETRKLTVADLIGKVAAFALYLIEYGNVVNDGDTIGEDEKDHILVRYRHSELYEMPVFYCTDNFKH